MLRRALLCSPALLLAKPIRAQERLAVVASFSVLGDMAKQIGGDRITLRNIAGPDQDAHGFQPKPSDAAALANAALVIRNGLGFEGWLDRMIRSSGFKGRLVTTTEGITPRMMEAHGHHSHDHGGAGRRQNHSVGPRQVPDPHGWQDLGLGQHYARNITAGLIAADPAGEALYRRNAEAYAARMGFASSRAGEQSRARRSMGERLSTMADMKCYNVTILGSVKALPWSRHATPLRLPS
ncbi:MAG: hypothetical protein EBU14_16420 [Acetobacteraceae bacterium]|nr:hypothetical protein [Acetobacteraceae bacterium]